MRHVADVLFALLFLGFSVMGIARPAIIADWAKMSHPEFTGDDRPLLITVRMIAIMGLILSIFFSVIIFRSLKFP